MAFRRAESEAEDHVSYGYIEGHAEACQELWRLGGFDGKIREFREYIKQGTFVRIINSKRKRVEATE